MSRRTARRGQTCVQRYLGTNGGRWCGQSVKQFTRVEGAPGGDGLAAYRAVRHRRARSTILLAT
eukprot:86815-Lingulodinium_polyedra.AAC.1